MTPEAGDIYRLMPAILGKLPAIGKDQKNAGLGYSFRGVDDVMTALKPLLAGAGVFYVPRVLERISEVRTTSRGTPQNVVHLLVEFTFFAPDGSHVVARTWGEGQDSADKATNKAHTAALKYALLETFNVATEEMAQSDPDRDHVEASTAQNPLPADGPSSPPASARGTEARPGPASNGAPSPAGSSSNGTTTEPTIFWYLRWALDQRQGDDRQRAENIIQEHCLGEEFPTTAKQAEGVLEQFRGLGWIPLLPAPNELAEQRRAAIDRARALPADRLDALRAELRARGAANTETWSPADLAFVNAWIEKESATADAG